MVWNTSFSQLDDSFGSKHHGRPRSEWWCGFCSGSVQQLLVWTLFEEWIDRERNPCCTTRSVWNSQVFFFTSSHSQIHSFTWHSTIGRSPAHKDPADEVGPFAARAGMIETLEQLGFESLHVYDEVREYYTSAVITNVHKNALNSLFLTFFDFCHRATPSSMHHGATS